MIKETIEREIGKYLAEQFAEWAFGKNFKTINLKYDAWKIWNDLHSTELELKGNGYPGEDLPKMIEIWKKNCDKNNH